MEMDRFGRSTVRNIYFDTDDFVLARHSIAKPDFKEKLRVRCYAEADADSTVFVELKRKFDGVVYKRRVGLREADAMRWMAGSNDPAVMSSLAAGSPQVTSEIEYFRGLYSGLKPVLYLSYDREAYRMKDGAHAADGGARWADRGLYRAGGSAKERPGLVYRHLHRSGLWPPRHRHRAVQSADALVRSGRRAVFHPVHRAGQSCPEGV